MIRTGISVGTVARYARQVGPHLWIGNKLLKLELEKRFFNQLHPRRHEGKGGKIRQASFRLTDRCNLRCHTCGQWGDNGYLHSYSLNELKEREIPTERYLHLLKDLGEHGHQPLVYFWGGEPMLYEGILDLIAGATDLGLPTSIATNGTRLAASAERLVEAPLFLLQVSIDGHCAELHNALRPSAGGGGDNFRDIKRGLAAVREARQARGRNLPLIAALTVISQANAAHLNDIYEAFRDEVDLFVFYLSWWIDEASAAAHEDDFSRRFGVHPTLHRGWVGGWRPGDPGALDRELQTVFKKSRAWSAPAVALVPPLTGTEELNTYYADHGATFGYDKCVSIYQVVEVDSNGDLSPCRDYHDYVVGNVRTATISELWNSPRYRDFRLSLNREGLMPVCTRCCGLMGY
jgi:radical SAM protein with 4Fe4S-binding SPASM domain